MEIQFGSKIDSIIGWSGVLCVAEIVAAKAPQVQFPKKNTNFDTETEKNYATDAISTSKCHRRAIDGPLSFYQ